MGAVGFVLTQKKLLTSDVYFLSFECEEEKSILPGQFITFLLPKTKFARAYSVLFAEKNSFSFIIKRLENGRGGSKEICDYEVGTRLLGVGPTGHFLVSEKQNSKLFIGTGTGMVPLYFQITSLLKKGYSHKIHLLLGNRTQEDLYYIDEFESLSQQYPNFSYQIFLSKEQTSHTKFGYVGDVIDSLFVDAYQEYYLCGNPSMIDQVKEKLQTFGVDSQHIHFEKY